MDTSESYVERILERMRVPGHERLFVLGCFEKPATLYMQQVRALNLVYALSKSCRSLKSVAVVGAGAGGVTAAAAAAVSGWRVSIFDTIENDVLSLAGADTDTRWLHPHIYDWPADGKDSSAAGLPILSWSAGPSKEVVASLRGQWWRLQAQLAIDTNLGVVDVSLLRDGQGYLVSWNGEPSVGGVVTGSWGSRAGRRTQVRQFDAVVLAVGFGMEQRTDRFPAVISYWKHDEFDHNSRATNAPRTVLVSGNGDGGLIDILRFSFLKFRHDRVLRQLRDEWLGKDAFEEVRQKLLQIEADAREARLRGEPYEPRLNQSYFDLANSLVLENPIPLRKEFIPILTSRSPLPLTLESAPLNRFLFSLTTAQYVRGPIERVVRVASGSGWDVTFATRPAIVRYDEVIVRHGPVSALETGFSEIHGWCKPLQDNAGAVPDVTREPRFDKPFAEALAHAARRASPPEDLLQQQNLVQAVVAVRSEAGAEAFAAYRQSIETDLDNVFDGIGSSYMLIARSVRMIASGRSPQTDPANKIGLGSSEIADEKWLTTGAASRIIVGETGSGKTLLMKSLLRQIVRDEQFFPVFVSLRDASLEAADSLIAQARKWMLSTMTPYRPMVDERQRMELERSFDTRSLQGRVVLFVDGLDEVPRPALTAFAQALSIDLATPSICNRVIISARRVPDPIRDLGMPVYEVLPGLGLLERVRLVRDEIVLDLIGQMGGAVTQIARLVVDPEFVDSVLPAAAAGRLDRAQQHELHAMLKSLPESLDFTILRVRTRCILHAGVAAHTQVEQVAEDIARFVGRPDQLIDETFTRLGSAVFHSRDRIASSLLPRLARLIRSDEARLVQRVIAFLGTARMVGTVQVVAPLLLSPDEPTREAAAEALGECGDEAALPFLRNAYLNSLGSMVFRECVRAMGKIGGAKAVAEVVQLLTDSSLFRNRRWPAAEVLGGMGDMSAETVLIEALREPADSIREAAAASLGQLNSSAAVPHLVQALHDAEASVRIAAAKALGQIDSVGREHGAALTNVLANDDHRVVRIEAGRALRKVDAAAALTALRKVVSDSTSSARPEALMLMVEQVGAEALDTALLLAKSPDERIVVAAAEALQVIRDPDGRAASGLVDLVGSKLSAVREAAIEGLAAHQYIEAVPLIVLSAEHDRESQVRMAAVKALGSMREVSASHVMIRAVERNEWYASLPLGQLGLAEAIPVLAAAWQASMKGLREYYSLAIGRIGGPAAIRTLSELSVAADVDQMLDIVNALEEIHDAAVVPGLLLALGGEDAFLSAVARHVLIARPWDQIARGLHLALSDDVALVRREAATAAPFYADEVMAAKLRELSEDDPNLAVVNAARTALESYANKQKALGFVAPA